MNDLAEMLGRYWCPSCHKPYQRSDLEWVGVGDSDMDLYMRCCSCNLQTMLIVRYDDRAPARVPEIQEPVPPPLPAISADEVLDMHLFLKNFIGDVRGLLQTRT